MWDIKGSLSLGYSLASMVCKKIRTAYPKALLSTLGEAQTVALILIFSLVYYNVRDESFIGCIISNLKFLLVFFA